MPRFEEVARRPPRPPQGTAPSRIQKEKQVNADPNLESARDKVVAALLRKFLKQAETGSLVLPEASLF